MDSETIFILGAWKMNAGHSQQSKQSQKCTRLAVEEPVDPQGRLQVHLQSLI